MVKAIVFQESRIGYDKTAGINVMQVGKAHDPSIKTIRGELKEYWVHDGKLQRLKYDARVTNIEESIKWGTRWLYHKARENVPGLKQAWKQIWKTWYVAVKEYGPGPESYAKSVWRIYTEGIKKEKDLTITLWSWNFLTILLAALMFFQPAPPQPTLSDIITREMSPEERLYIDDIETGYAGDGSLFWAIVATNKDWWEEIKVGRNVNHGIQWLPMKEVPDEQSILKARFLKLRGFQNPILEVYGKTHVGNGAIHLYEVGQSEVKLLLEVPYSVDSYYDDVWLPENNEKYGHYNCGDVIRGDALDSKYVDLNNDGVDDLILSGVRDMFCDTESSDKNKEPGLVKVDERRIEEQFVWNPAAGHYEMNESK
ncbi:hypothetical protein HY224_01945 [Candidatus Uhrbacteria bacterium]|nr:hypothetical protein [Candidatus Uhrbacteria bacterium]